MNTSRRHGTKATEESVRSIIRAKIRGGGGRIGRETAAARSLLLRRESDSETALKETAARISRALSADRRSEIDADEPLAPPVTITCRHASAPRA